MISSFVTQAIVIRAFLFLRGGKPNPWKRKAEVCVCWFWTMKLKVSIRHPGRDMDGQGTQGVGMDWTLLWRLIPFLQPSGCYSV